MDVVQLSESHEYLEITRADFEALCRPACLRAMEIVKRALLRANIGPTAIDEVCALF